MNKRDFLITTCKHFSAIAACGLFLPANAAHTAFSSGIVRQPEEGETFFVRPNTPITICISKRSDSNPPISFCLEEIQPGDAIPEHKHLHEAEFFFFFSGSGKFIIDERAAEIKPGTCALVPENTFHAVKNTGTDILKFAFGFSPAGFEDFFKQIGTPAGLPFKAKTPAEMKQLAAQYGMVYK